MSYNKNISVYFAGALLLLEVTECFYALTQWIGFFESGNPRYGFTGSFYNPGPFACYIALGVPVAVRMMVKVDNRLQRWLGMGIVALSAILLPATMSRTAIAACIVGCLISVCDELRESITKKRIILCASTFIVGAGMIYFVKRDSADGRLLMWKVATIAAKEIPTTGVGWEQVAGAFGNAQEAYFANGHGSEQERTVADAPQYVFNEYLQVAIAFGPLASIGMIAVLVGGIIVALHSHNYAIGGSAVAVSIVMFASYPLQFPLFTVTIALIVCSAWLTSECGTLGWSMVCVIAVLCVLFLTHSDTVDVQPESAVAHSLHKSKEYRRSNDYLLKLLPYTSDPMPLNILGKNYRAMGMPDSAEHYLRRSTYRCPNRLYPHYLLMQLYGDSTYLHLELQRREARHILTSLEKIPSRAIEEMRDEAKKVFQL